jgi:hypothetical protein
MVPTAPCKFSCTDGRDVRAPRTGMIASRGVPTRRRRLLSVFDLGEVPVLRGDPYRLTDDDERHGRAVEDDRGG